MNLEQIEQMWEVDCRIDLTDLGRSTADAAEMHHKYSKLHNGAKIRLAQLEGERNRMILLKTDYFMGNVDKKTLDENGWRPFQRTVLKSDLPVYLQADEDMILLNLKVATIQQIISFLESIIRTLNNRDFKIKNILEERKFLNA